MDAKVVVLGSINSDLLVSTPRLPQPGETLRGENIEYQLGGKGANQAVAAARAGAHTILIGAVGRDDQGSATLGALERHGVQIQGVIQTAASTGFAAVLTSPQDNQIIIIPGANGNVDEQLADSAPIAPGDLCLAQLETPLQATRRFFERGRAMGATIVLNAAPADPAARDLIPLLDILIVNESECRDLADMPDADLAEDARLIAAARQAGLGSEQVLILTLGAAGVAMVSGGGVQRIEGEKVTVVDTTGAGDCFCGYVSAGLAQGLSLEAATRRANVAASLAVQSRGAASSMPASSTVAKLRRAEQAE